MFKPVRYFYNEGAPIKCQICGTEDNFEVINSYMEYIIMEMEVICPTCNCTIGHWVTGNWDPCFEFGDL